MSLGNLIEVKGALFSEGAVNVDFDKTFLVQTAFFIGLMLVLKPLLFDPMLKLFEEREKRTAGAKLEARRIDEASAGALAKYEKAMAAARATAAGERDKIRAEGVKAENEILSKVRAATAKRLEEGRGLLQKERLGIEEQLDGEAKALAGTLAHAVLGREVSE